MTDDEIRRLRGVVRGLEDENAALKERLTAAYQEIEYVRERLSSQTPVLRTAAPRDFERAGLVPVTTAELQAVKARLHELLGEQCIRRLAIVPWRCLHPSLRVEAPWRRDSGEFGLWLQQHYRSPRCHRSARKNSKTSASWPSGS